MWLLSSLILFMGCPTPPDQVSSNTSQGQGPNSGPKNGPQGTPPGQPNGSGENGTPPNGPNGAVNNDSPEQNGGNGQPNDPNTQTGDPTLDRENKPEEGSVQADGDGEEAKKEGEDAEKEGSIIPTPEGEDGGVEAVQLQGEPPPQNAEPTPVTESILIRVERIPSKGAKQKHKQEQLKNEDHITLTGTATCKDCEGPLVLRVVRFLGPNDNHSENNLLTQKTVESGDFSILVPEGETPIALELLVDKNEDGQPSASEYFAVIEMAGQLIPDKNRSELNLDSTKRDFFAPAPIPGTQGPQ